ncbi:NAD(P)/FAD-dependent oxidoreductase [Nitrospirillum viridazoti]|uniref:FAD-dependent oxidoreductase n=1 Tax=Nitrospirillum viridazoti CBAmc TaxID=1441467 RepID=A0A248K0Z2_9PROT|nr:FAD-binding oxidoreductase [Nitrospirillum amazonense]ASG24436.1 FAD-dependent oxidoreductase [Nitrospirillum amazonense CBAmc]TWB33396.1 glycine/D-amino acid oxidase-like deaminating enzyme [Nitrospirillum amazonense]
MTGPKTCSYWLDTAPPFTGGADGGLDSRTDVAIIGAGFTGLSAALALRQRGVSVTVLEADRAIGAASGRNGGHCNNGLAHDYAALSAKLGRDRAGAYYRAHVAAVDTVERLARENDIDCDFRRPGRLKLAAKPEHFEKLARAYDVLRAEIDTDVELVAPGRIGDEIGSAAFHGGLIQTTSAQLHVGKFGVGMAHAAARAGARIHEHTPVTDILRRPGGGWRVVTPRGEIVADQVLIATGGGGTGGALRPLQWFRRRIVSVGSFIIATQPLDPTLLDRLFPNRRNYVTSKNIGNYFRTTTDNRLVFGGRARFAVSNPLSDLKSGRILEATLGRTFPELAGTRIDYCWGGMVDLTADRLPRAGQHDGLYYSMGYSGHGVQMATYMGERMAEVMVGRPQANPWADLDWPSIPGHLGKPWFLPLVGAYYRVQDILH